MIHKAIVSFVGRRQKTAKTCCGKTVKLSCIAINTDATCESCRAFVDAEKESYEAAIDSAKACGLDSGPLEVAFKNWFPVRYQTPYFL